MTDFALAQMCTDFSILNPHVSVSPTQIAWKPFPLPPDSEKVDFIDGLKTVAGTGDPQSKEGLAIHMYLANTSMEHRAFVNNEWGILSSFLLMSELTLLHLVETS